MKARPIGFLPSLNLQNKWRLRHYFLRANELEDFRQPELQGHYSRLLEAVEPALSNEYVYARFGFAVSHFGTRGVCFTVWHWGTWGPTIELYTQAWYCFGRDLSALEPLARVDPVCCLHEMRIVRAETLLVEGFVANAGKLPTVTEFFETIPIL